MNKNQLGFDKNEIDLLMGLFAKLYQIAGVKKEAHMAGAWVHLGQVINKPAHTYIKAELELFSMAVEQCLASGENAIKMILAAPEVNIAAKVRAEVINKTYLTIKEKVDHAKLQLQSSGSEQSTAGAGQPSGSTQPDTRSDG